VPSGTMREASPWSGGGRVTNYLMHTLSVCAGSPGYLKELSLVHAIYCEKTAIRLLITV